MEYLGCQTLHDIGYDGTNSRADGASCRAEMCENYFLALQSEGSVQEGVGFSFDIAVPWGWYEGILECFEEYTQI